MWTTCGKAKDVGRGHKEQKNRRTNTKPTHNMNYRLIKFG